MKVAGFWSICGNRECMIVFKFAAHISHSFKECVTMYFSVVSVMFVMFMMSTDSKRSLLELLWCECPLFVDDGNNASFVLLLCWIGSVFIWHIDYNFYFLKTQIPKTPKPWENRWSTLQKQNLRFSVSDHLILTKSFSNSYTLNLLRIGSSWADCSHTYEGE